MHKDTAGSGLFRDQDLDCYAAHGVTSPDNGVPTRRSAGFCDLSPAHYVRHIFARSSLILARGSRRLAPTIDAVGNSQAYSQTYSSLTQDVQNLITLHPSTEGPQVGQRVTPAHFCARLSCCFTLRGITCRARGR